MQTVILSAVRTPIGKFLGSFSHMTAMHLASTLVPPAIERAGLVGSVIDEVIMGHVLQAGCGQNPARQVALAGGLPPTVAAVTINKVCGSGLKAVMLADQAIRAGDSQLILAGGMESMSNAPHLLQGTRHGLKYGDVPFVDALIRDGLWCAHEHWPMGNAAEYIAQKCEISRAEQDRFSLQSHQRAASASTSGFFQKEVIPISVGKGKLITHDEGIRADSSLEQLAKLRPAFDPHGSVTAGNSSQLSDGAAMLLLATPDLAERTAVKPIARIIAAVTTGVAPKEIFFAPVSAIQSVLQKAQLTQDDVDVFEINEAFAAQVLATIQILKLDESRVNIHGGGIALGHPIGASGARILVHLIQTLNQIRGRYGLATLCLGGGNAVAMVIERIG